MALEIARKPMGLLLLVAMYFASLLFAPAARADSLDQGYAYRDCLAQQAQTAHSFLILEQCHDTHDNVGGGNWSFGYEDSYPHAYVFVYPAMCTSRSTSLFRDAELGPSAICSNGCSYAATSTSGGLTQFQPSGQVCEDPVRPVLAQNENAGACKSGHCHDSPPHCNGVMCGDPINTATGNLFQAENDLTGSGLLEFTRYYNSAGTAVAQTLGPHWSHTYMRAVYHPPNELNSAYVMRPDGRVSKFEYSSSGWKSSAWPEALLERLLDSGGGTAGWKLQARDGREVENFDNLGRLTSIVRTDGTSVSLTYNDFQVFRVQDQSGRRLQFQYDSSGRLSQITDPAGQVTTYGYDSVNRLTSVTYPGAVGKTYIYNESANTASTDLPVALTGIQDERENRFATFKYQSDGKAVSAEHYGAVEKVTVAYGSGSNTVTLPSSQAVTRAFVSPVGVMQSSSDSMTAGGVTRTTSYTYDSHGFLNVKTDSLSTTTDHDYDANGRETQLIESANVSATKRTTQTDWDSTFDVPTERRVYNASAVLESKSTWTYNTRGQVLTATIVNLTSSSLSRTTTYTYCESAGVTAGTCPIVGLLLSVDGPLTSPTVDVTSYTYRQADHSSCSTAPTTCPYRRGDLWKVTDALGHVTETLKYDGAGRPISVKDANGVVTDLEYNGRGWLTARKLRGSNDSVETDDAITRLEYDPIGQVTKVTEPDGVFAGFTYDPAHRLTTVTDALGNSVHYTLDNDGHRIQEDTKNAASVVKRTLSSVYDTLGQLETLADANATPTDFTYDANGALDTTTDMLSRVTDNDVDALGRLKQVIANTGGSTSDKATTQFQYDARDNLRTVIDPKGLSTTYDYDSVGNLTGLTSPDTGSTLFGYDLAGNRTSEQKADSVTQGYTYDAIGRLTGKTFAHSAQNVSFTYDSTETDCATGETFNAGHLTKITDASGSTRYCYDARGHRVRQVQTLTAGSTLTLSPTYNSADRLVALTYPSGAIVVYLRDDDGRITGIDAVPSPSGPQVTLVDDVTYLPFGPLNTLVFGNGRVLTKSYDQNYEIASVVDSASTNPMSQVFTLDNVGKVTGLTERTDASNTVSRTFMYDGLDRVTAQMNGSAAVEGFSYDSTGNRLSKTDGTTTSYSYASSSHRLTSVGSTGRTYNDTGETQTIGTGSTGKAFTFNDDHRLTAASLNSVLQYTNVYNGLGQRVGKLKSSDSRQFIYDDSGRLMGEYTATGDRVKEYVWLDDTLVAILGDFDGKDYHYVETDHLGTPRVVVHPTKNTIEWRWDLNATAFGEHTPNGDPDGDSLTYELSLRFPGQYHDDESGLNYNYSRDYDPTTGRYIESDPIGLPAGPSLYAYVSDRPLTSFDSRGLSEFGDHYRSVGLEGIWNGWEAQTEAEDAVNSEASRGNLGGPVGLTNGPGDAVRHCTWSCLMTRRMDKRRAKAIGDIHELWGRRAHQPIDQEVMDRANNARGRSCAATSPGTCFQNCLSLYQEGNLFRRGGLPMKPGEEW